MEFIKEVEDRQSCRSDSNEKTGWESVVFELQDVLAEVLDEVLSESG